MNFQKRRVTTQCLRHLPSNLKPLLQTDTCKIWIPAFAGMTQMTQNRFIGPLLTLERKNIVKIHNKMKRLQTGQPTPGKNRGIARPE